jgi:hypothetical protein
MLRVAASRSAAVTAMATTDFVDTGAGFENMRCVFGSSAWYRICNPFAGEMRKWVG